MEIRTLDGTSYRPTVPFNGPAFMASAALDFLLGSGGCASSLVQVKGGVIDVDGCHFRATERHLPYGITHSHSVTCLLTQVNAPLFNPSQIGRYSIYLLQRHGRLSSPRHLVTCRDGLLARRQSPIQVLTRPGVG